MTLKKIGYINDPFRYTDCFKLKCYIKLPYASDDYTLVEKDMYFTNTKGILPYIEELIKIRNALNTCKKENGLDGKQIISAFQSIYKAIQNKAIEQFRYIDEVNIDNFGFTIIYIDKDGYENSLEVV